MIAKIRFQLFGILIKICYITFKTFLKIKSNDVMDDCNKI